MIPFLLIGGGVYLLFDALGNKRPSYDPADLGLPTKGYRGYRKGASHFVQGGIMADGGKLASPITFGKLEVGKEYYQVKRPDLGIEKIKITKKESSSYSYISDNFDEEIYVSKYKGGFSDNIELYGIYKNKEDAKRKAIEILEERMSKYAKGGKTPKLYAVLYLHSEPVADVEVDSQDEKAALKKFQDMGVNIPPNSTIRFQKNEPYYYAKGGEVKNPYAEFLLSNGFEKSYEIKKEKFTEYRKGKWYCWIDERTKEVEVGKYDIDYSAEDVKKYGGVRENNSPYYHSDKYTNSLSKFKKFLDDNYILEEVYKDGGKTMYEGLEVEIRPASKYSKKFIVWDIETDQIFANEKFDSVEEAKKFVKQNKMKIKC